MSIYSYSRPRFILLGLAHPRCTVGRQFVEWIRMHGDGLERGPEDFTSWTSTSPVLGDISESEIMILLRPWATDPIGLANSAVKALNYFGLKEKDIALAHGLPFMARGRYKVQHSLYPLKEGEEVPATLVNQKQPRVYAYDKVPELVGLSTMAKALGTTFYKRVEIGTKFVRTNREPPSEIFPEAAKDVLSRIHGRWQDSDLIGVDCPRAKDFARTMPNVKEFGYVGEEQAINTWRRTFDNTKDPKPIALQQHKRTATATGGGGHQTGQRKMEGTRPLRERGAQRRNTVTAETGEEEAAVDEGRERLLARVLHREHVVDSHMDRGVRIRWSAAATAKLPMG